jgi:hypothetical protein
VVAFQGLQRWTQAERKSAVFFDPNIHKVGWHIHWCHLDWRPQFPSQKGAQSLSSNQTEPHCRNPKLREHRIRQLVMESTRESQKERIQRPRKETARGSARSPWRHAQPCSRRVTKCQSPERSRGRLRTTRPRWSCCSIPRPARRGWYCLKGKVSAVFGLRKAAGLPRRDLPSSGQGDGVTPKEKGGKSYRNFGGIRTWACPPGDSGSGQSLARFPAQMH